MVALGVRRPQVSGQVFNSLLSGDGFPGTPPIPAAEPPMAGNGEATTFQPPRPSSSRPDYAAMMMDAIGPEPKMSGLQKAAAIIGPALMAATGNVSGANQAQAMIADRQNSFADRRRQALMEAVKWGREDDLAREKANQPQFFSGNEDRIRYDPATGTSTRVYNAPQDFEDYAAAGGLEPGSPEYFSAVQDYVLRGNGPTAFNYDRQLEQVRQAGRISLEGTRHQNRLNVRGAPTYRDLHPQPKAATGSTKSGKARPTATGPNGQKIEWDGNAWVPVR